ncbi:MULTISPECIES: DUF1800 family protein [unclassified Beijerinckia]|uniref:DUF1800 domain-containing protein n=1 Tax=unclassified Beijerinckia TaxID=2638183 RepID=UPI000899E9D2|nr:MULTISPECIES: DUF1800 family protein [unclassified Beijerinckia]MDH7798531.1 uncharacterized protein (DUF1800 family) [Beijerinckia sp. GAS462]SED24002.1 Uncharacterized conserved protein, DUF1800 family [Beijerinckia sp. 28-YEA-48]
MTANTSAQQALVALNRFGYGARGGNSGDLAAAAADPRDFVLTELASPRSALLENPTLHSTDALLNELYGLQAQDRVYHQALNQQAANQQAANQQAANQTANANTRTADAPTDTNTPASQPPAPPPLPPQPNFNVINERFRAEALARIQRAHAPACGYVERLVAFWSNHFCISAIKGPGVRIAAGAFEREAIRPHVLGRFADMLHAVEQHPAMLFYLDNAQSIGPNSRAGQNGKRGLNENLARETMELHTLGVDGGYTQADVTSFARIITGWTVVGPAARLGTPGTFTFNANAHEPGTHTLLNRAYAEDGVAQGEHALADLARHPSTAKFIATKLVRHFIADDPPPPLVDKLAKVFRDSDGDLKAISLALVNDPLAWSTPQTKIRSPYEFLVASSRLFARTPDQPQRYIGSLALMGAPLWQPPGPNGYADSNFAWATPNGMKVRLEISNQIAKRLGNLTDPEEALDAAAGAAASADLRQAIGRAESREQAIALVLMSPEFQRR